MTSYPETLTVKKLIKMRFFSIKIYYISSSNDPNITHTVPKIILVVSCTLKFQSEHTKMCGFGKIEPVAQVSHSADATVFLYSTCFWVKPNFL
jgi:hypothetical protein